MKNGISKRIIAGVMLSIFVSTNILSYAFAKEDLRLYKYLWHAKTCNTRWK